MALGTVDAEREVEKKLSFIEGLLAGVTPLAHLDKHGDNLLELFQNLEKDLTWLAKMLANLTVPAATAERLHLSLTHISKNVLGVKDALEPCTAHARIRRIYKKISEIEELLDDILEDLGLASALHKLTSQERPGKSWREAWAGSKSK
jgi:hypothetical protein